MKNKNGFTLIELIVVVLLMAILIAIVVPNVTKLIGKQSDTEYNAQLKMVKSGLDLYTIRHQGTFKSIDKNCIIMDYSILINEGLIKENNITCSGKVVLTPKKSSYSYEYFLNCSDNKGNVKSSYNNNDLPTGCYNIN